MTLFTPVIDVKRPYCGPAAISILTGVPVSRAEHMIRRGRRGGYRNSAGRRMPIRGTYNWEVLKVLKRLGCKIQEFTFAKGSFQKFVDDTRHAGTFLVNVTGHYMTCSAGLVADNTITVPAPVENYHRGRRMVRKAWKVLAPQLPKYTIDDALVATHAPKPRKDIKVVRAEKTLALVKKWERKEKLAKTKLKKLRSQLRRYQKNGIV